MSRRKRSRQRPQRPKPETREPQPSEEAAPPAVEVDDELREELADHGLQVEEPESYDPAVGEPVLRRLVDALDRGDGLTDQERAEIDVGLSAAGLTVGPTPEEPEESGERAAAPVEELPEEAPEDRAGDGYPIDDDFDAALQPPEISVEIPVLERGPLAVAIQSFEAMLTEAKAGYITQQIAALEAAINESFTPHEHGLMAEAASQWRDAHGLPDVPAAYQALVVHRATQSIRQG